MDHGYHDEELIELGRPSVDTRGGPMGYLDSERTMWLHNLSLAED